MRNRLSWITGVGSALLALAGAAGAEGNPVQATVDRPALVTAVPAPQLGMSAGMSRVVIDVTAFKPAQDGTVQAVVKAQKPDGTEQEIGRFALFPEAEFQADAAGATGAQRFSVPLPKELAGQGPVKLKVELLPTRGKGEGARLEVGGAEIR